MTATYSISEMKQMIPYLDEEGIEILADLLIKEKESFRTRDYKTVYRLLQQRIDFLKNNKTSWTKGFCFN